MSIKHKGEDRFYALLSYIGTIPFLIIPLFLIPLILKRKEVWVYRHAKQGCILFLGFLLTVIPLLGWIWGVYLLVTGIIAIVKVIKGDPFWKIPIIGDISEKLNL